MAVPQQGEFYRPVLEIIAESVGGISRQDLIEASAGRLHVNDSDRREAFGGRGTVLMFDYRVTSAALKLNEAGLVRRPRRGHYEITTTGENYLTEYSGPIERNALVQLQRTFQPEEPGTMASPQSIVSEGQVDEVAPTELLAVAYRALLRDLANDLQASMNGVSPDRFEQLVVDLLEKMGYGEGQTVGRTGDGGIDGIINQDALGLEKVFVQAKRYTTGAVGEPEVRNFSGSLDARGATKGVFITTSTFSSTARQTAQTISAGNKFIRLVDGNELAQLMIRHGVGVVTEYTYEIKKLDENYFADEG